MSINGMMMDGTEIVNNYRAAKDKKKQIRILSELNDCSVERIKEILIAGGVKPQELPRNRCVTVPDEKPEKEEQKPQESKAAGASPMAPCDIISIDLPILRGMLEKAQAEVEKLDVQRRAAYERRDAIEEAMKACVALCAVIEKQKKEGTL